MVTVLGKTMGKLPVAPRYAKMILMAHQENCMQYMITIIAALTVKVCIIILKSADELLLNSLD